MFASLAIAAAVFALSIRANRKEELFERLLFWPEKIIHKREYYRVLSSAFVHTSPGHLLFNIFTLLSFGINIEYRFGTLFFILLFSGSTIGGNLLTLLLKRDDNLYRSAGASGGVSGLIFASVFLIPELSVHLFFIPYGIPGWLFAILFSVISVYGLKQGTSFTSHETHIGGAAAGTLISGVWFPHKTGEMAWLAITVIIVFFIFLFYTLYQKSGSDT
jgi:membrane associated rhomboid family serine protease